MTRDTFETAADRYDLLIDWPKRLANETPFYRRWFKDHGVEAVLDVACGTGRHLEMFHDWGLRVEGADVSNDMIAICRQRLPESPSCRWVQRSFDQPCETPGGFDAAICVGNSLALACDATSPEQVIASMFTAVAPGGVCVVQVLNLWRLPDGETIWQKCKRVAIGGEDHVLLKTMRRKGNRGHAEFVDITLTGDETSIRHDTTTFAGIEADHLAQAAREAGATMTRLFGDYHFTQYNRKTSEDCILVATR